ncbi:MULTISPECIES: TetR/AcrR family transcriptional regulator C-terminal domain-containing protein [unclassified Mesorhizobium]|uniref:TetR/AcrR family transcriptional regulator C-terminal domain-containing protein n=1 Tax=unclassified Mesorhizobium TaxID=325217 RepID=UPI00112A870C|nr:MULTISPECIES: TetR/AcrR family transcriptional regulator C-terminal domain-containing protein [unclassified Mesorhizobium]MCA0023115.1 TetR/AcrR family transcriptional regulator C-terminal domain-containing protein [Mesorhizobium sp. B263B1A]TPJ98907.1 TetR family transcriptional regulator [Mesorhizobium sp. B2-5-12]TPK29071.1 TetR family transcriptional regulator [Mesorhizobium sp. B2-5-6]
MKLDKALIVAQALELLNDVGIDALSTRLLAQRLKVQQPALYWHFRTKRALLDAMNEEILRRGHGHQVLLPGESWQEFVRNNARSFRGALMAYRDGARVHAGTEADPGDLEHVERLLTFLREAGMPSVMAMRLLMIVGRYTVGCVLEEQAEYPAGPGRGAALDAKASGYPLLSQALADYRAGGHEALFESGLDLLIAGAQAGIAEGG